MPTPRTHSIQARALQVAGIGIAVVGLLVAHKAKPLSARNAEPTFAEDVAPIIYKNCASCHRPGGLGPFSLLDYDSVMNNIPEMRQAVSTGAMPPWHADGPRNVFRNDRRLSDSDKQTILRWIDGGAKPGDLKSQPPKPEFPVSSAIGKPDAVVTMPEDYVVPATGTIAYQYFQVPTNIKEEKWVQAIEIMPGAREVVHHVLVYAYVPPDSATVAAATAAALAARAAGTPPRPPLLLRNRTQGIPPEPPRAEKANAEPRQLGALIGTTAPGTNVVEFPKGTAMRLRAGTILTFQMHYTAHGHEMKDRTSVGFKFAKEMPDEEIFATQFLNGSFTLPAGAKDVQVPSDLGVSVPIRVWGLFPHTHLRGTRWQYKMDKPDGTSSIILDVPRYDFNWQTYYLFATPLEMAPGDKINAMAWYDNSVTNKHNPDPTKDVHWGDQTWEEMQYTGLLYSVPSRRLRPAGQH